MTFRDITFCDSNNECPFKDCMRHYSHLEENTTGMWVSMADFRSGCDRFKTYFNEYLSAPDADVEVEANNTQEKQ